ncbi:hypothetical protein Gohar_006642, partial [Gossypium harknessii]|nr:hypothetical protein [Gossypium harknessii]
PEGAASDIYLIQYALALVLKESFKIYSAINDGIMNLIDVFFKMSQDDAVKALGIYKRAGQQVEELAEFYEYCKGLELAKNFQFPALRQPPPSFLATMEEYVKEAPQSGSVQNKLEYEGREQVSEVASDETKKQGEIRINKLLINEQEKSKLEEPRQLILMGDLLLGPYETNPTTLEIEKNNGMALAIVPSVDSVYEDEAIRRQKQLTNARYGSEGMMPILTQQQQYPQQQQPMMMTVPYQYPQQLQVQYMGHFNPFGEPPLFGIPANSILLQ